LDDFDGEIETGGEEEDAINESTDNFRTNEAISISGSFISGSEAKTDESHDDGKDIGQHVKRIGLKSQRIGNDPHNEFD